MANHEPDKAMFDLIKEGMKKLSDSLTQWQQKETAIHSLAEAHAKQSGAAPEHMDAHVYMHKKMIKRAMAEHAKQTDPEEQVKAQGGGKEGQGSGGPGLPQMPMAGQPGNTGANGWEGLTKPSPYPAQAQVQSGAPTQSGGFPVPGRVMPGLPTPGAQAGFTGTNLRQTPLTSPRG